MGELEIERAVGQSLQEAIESCCDTLEEQVAILGTYVAVVGVIDTITGAWIIRHSTTPSLVGCLLVCTSEKEEIENVESRNCCSFCTIDNNTTLKEGSTLKQVLVGQGSFSREWKIV